MGWEGANAIFDSWVHPLMMGLEEHLIGMFRHDFEFVEGHRSHLGGHGTQPAAATTPSSGGTTAADPIEARHLPQTLITTTASIAGHAVHAPSQAAAAASGDPQWSADGEASLAGIPFFVRGKVRRNTERYARDHGLATITEEVLYDAKAHFSRAK
jgi:light-independent protochlorophyllide reductase subunit B